MDIFWTIVPALLYPILVAVASFFASRRALANSRLTLASYLLKGLLWLFLPPLGLILVMSAPWVLQYQGICSGWMDSPDRPCGLWEYIELQVFWSLMLGTVPILVGWGLTILVFAGSWFFHHRKRA